MIITLKIDELSKSHFSKLRQQFFPSWLNYLEAHLTLFHNIPDEPWIHDALAEQINISAFEMDVELPYHTGFGVAYKINSPELEKIQNELSAKLKEVLIAQDRKKFRPHITIQNKVTPVLSKALCEQLKNDFKASKITALGLSTFEYMDGPWKHIIDHHFSGKE